MENLPLNVQVVQASKRISGYIRKTPLIFAHHLTQMLNSDIYLKLESLQPTSSFKVRGAFNKLLQLSPEQLKSGVIAASTGNHGAAVAHACHVFGVPAIIFVAASASPSKIQAIESFGAVVQVHGEDCSEAETYAREYAKQQGLIYISPYNDIDVVAGQGTIGFEVLEQLPTVDVVLAPIGGGGLIAGIGGYIKEIAPSVQLIGCLPENSPVMLESIKAGKIVEVDCKPTLSDATAGNMEPGSITFPLCQKYVDDYICVSEKEIKEALQLLIEKEHLLAEGAVGVVLASLLKVRAKLDDLNVVVIVSGANVSLDNLRTVLC